jgi:hypothetical protein
MVPYYAPAAFGRCGLSWLAGMAGSHTTTLCRHNSGSAMLKVAIDGPFSDPDRAIVVKTVAVASSKRQRVSPSQSAKLLNLQGKPSRVLTGDPLGPRRCWVSCKSSLFSNTCKSRSWRRAVETCGVLLKPEAPDSYKIIYIFRLWSSVHPGDQPKRRRTKVLPSACAIKLRSLSEPN